MDHKDFMEQKDKILEERHQAVQGVEISRQRRLMDRIRDSFFVLGARASRLIRGRRREEGKEMVGLFQRVTGEEIIQHCEKTLRKINEVSNNKNIKLPLPAQRRMNYRRDFYEFMMYHTRRDVVYWLTMEEVAAIEMILTQEEAAFGE